MMKSTFRQIRPKILIIIPLSYYNVSKFFVFLKSSQDSEAITTALEEELGLLKDQGISGLKAQRSKTIALEDKIDLIGAQMSISQALENDIGLLKDQGIRDLEAQGATTKALEDKIDLLAGVVDRSNQALEAKSKYLEDMITQNIEHEAKTSQVQETKTEALEYKINLHSAHCGYQ